MLSATLNPPLEHEQMEHPTVYVNQKPPQLTDFSVLMGEVSFVVAYRAEALTAPTYSRQLHGMHDQA